MMKLNLTSITLISMLTLVAPSSFAQSETPKEKTATSVPPPPPAQSLPRPDFRFKGQIGRTYQDSDPPTFPQVVRPPKGAPNVLLILIDDAGYGQFSAFGGGVPHGAPTERDWSERPEISMRRGEILPAWESFWPMMACVPTTRNAGKSFQGIASSRPPIWHRVPEAWQPGKAQRGSARGYGYQFWLVPSEKRRFAFIGVFGQMMFVDPELKLVMAQTAADAVSHPAPLARDALALWKGVVRQYGSL